MNRFDAFIKILETGSFTKAAHELGYTQSAISQMVSSLEKELATKLIIRSRKGIELTPDGQEFLPYIRKLYNSYRELTEKSKELQGLQEGVIRIGTFSSVSSSWLPDLIKNFKKNYPMVKFELLQGQYTSIAQLIKEGSVDFGFVIPDAVDDLNVISIKRDEMLAILPCNHKLSKMEWVTMKQLSNEPFILLDEGQLSVPLKYFEKYKLQPNIQFRVYDDYTIMSMVEIGLGIAILPEYTLNKNTYTIVKKKINPPIVRTVGIAMKEKETLPIASRNFIDYIINHFNND